LHLWWARRPLAAARAVLWASLVDDPSGDPRFAGPAVETVAERAERIGRVDAERRRLFGILERLVRWESSRDGGVLAEARAEIVRCFGGGPPAVLDPFAGGGAIPLEAQRLGLAAVAGDLSPVAVLINKAMIEIPPKFAGRPPVNPEARAASGLLSTEWQGAQGLAEDVRFYGRWIRDEAEKRIGHLYPKIEITAEMVRERPDLKQFEGRKLTVISWLWARTVKSPNPAFANVDVPLASTFMLSTKKGKEAYVETVIEACGYRFAVQAGAPRDAVAARAGTKLSRGANFRCLMSGAPIAPDYIKAEATAGRMGARLMAIVAEGARSRVYLSPTPGHEAIAHEVHPEWAPDVAFYQHALGFRVGNYGMTRWSDLFTPRQLAMLSVFSGLMDEARGRIKRDAVVADVLHDENPLCHDGTGAAAYAEAVSVYLGFAVGKQADLGNSLCRWEPIAQCPRQLFGRQAIPMVWDYAEGNPLGDSSGSWTVFIEGIVKAFTRAFEGVTASASGHARQMDAGMQSMSRDKVISTDPPYYDNIGYADLSDFFYVWLRRALYSVFPDLFTTIAVPKTEELVATPGRYGGRDEAERFFLTGMTRAINRLAEQAHEGFPVSIYYAFKQSESKGDKSQTSTGWATFSRQ
jgi:putative DNA methylase